MQLPKIWATCEVCSPEFAGHRPEDVAWLPTLGQWICQECWYDLSLDEREKPLAYAKDVMLGQDEQMERLIAATTKRRLGGK